MFPDVNSIKSKRKALGLTQKQLANESGVSQSLIAKTESGRIEVSYSKIKRIFETLNRLSSKNEKKAEDIMSKGITSISPASTIKQASLIMKEKCISQLPIISAGKVIGSISESGIIDKMASVSNIQGKKVAEIMEECFPSVSKNMPVSALIPILRESKAIIVIDNGKPVGIISKTDVL